MAAQTQDLGGPLKATIDRRDGGTRVALVGYINDATNLSSLAKLTGPLHIDLSGIDRINSVGVKTWVQFVRDCERSGINLTCERCSPVIVQQLSMISNFMGTRARVASMYVVYVCPSCHAERLELVEITPGVRPSVAATLPCAKCKGTMQLDEVEEMYTRLFEKAG
jgi:anti-anti-sigma regulatory factor